MTFTEYFTRRFLLPQIITFNEPGRIISTSITRYGTTRSKIRLCYGFEDLMVHLQLATIERIGIVRSEQMWYEIGKTFTLRHLSFSGRKRVPAMLRAEVLTFILKGFQSAGLTVAENIEFDRSACSLVLYGKDNAICRYTGHGEINAGVVSGLMSFLYDQNIEADKVSCSTTGTCCRIIANKHIRQKCLIASLSSYLPTDKYLINFADFHPIREYSSLEKMIRFKKISFVGSMYNIEGHALIYIEAGYYEILYRIYQKYGLESLYDSTVAKSSSEITRTLTRGKPNPRMFMTNVLTALGWGIPSFTKSGSGYEILVVAPPYSDLGFSYLPQFLLGVISVFSGSRQELGHVSFDYPSNTLRIITRRMKPA